jgi:hypothetical protein
MLWLGYAALAVPAKVLYDHFAAYGTSRWIFACAVLIFVAAVLKEMSEAGCTPAKCTLDRNREAQAAPNPSGARAVRRIEARDVAGVVRARLPRLYGAQHRARRAAR